MVCTFFLQQLVQKYQKTTMYGTPPCLTKLRAFSITSHSSTEKMGFVQNAAKRKMASKQWLKK